MAKRKKYKEEDEKSRTTDKRKRESEQKPGEEFDPAAAEKYIGGEKPPSPEKYKDGKLPSGDQGSDWPPDEPYKHAGVVVVDPSEVTPVTADQVTAAFESTGGDASQMMKMIVEELTGGRKGKGPQDIRHAPESGSHPLATEGPGESAGGGVEGCGPQREEAGIEYAAEEEGLGAPPAMPPMMQEGLEGSGLDQPAETPGAEMQAVEPESCGCAEEGGEKAMSLEMGREYPEEEEKDEGVVEIKGSAIPVIPVEAVTFLDDTSFAVHGSDDDDDDDDDDDEGEEEKKEEREKEGAAILPSETHTEQVYETLGRIESLGNVRADSVELFLTQEDTPNAQYVVFVEGLPVAKVALADQSEHLMVDHPDMFTSEDYPRFVLEGIDRFGLADTLKSINARYFAAEALAGEVAAEMKVQATHELENAHREKLAQTKDNLINVANIVLQGSMKNYILENPLKDSLMRYITQAGVTENGAIDIIEAAWQESGDQYFRAVLAKAEEWMSAPQEVLDHHINEITAMGHRHPGYVESDVDDEISVGFQPEAPRAPVEEVPTSVPVQTMATASVQYAGTKDWRAEAQAWKQKMNLHGRVAAASLPNTPKKG